jgi:hypothetical protein
MTYREIFLFPIWFPLATISLVATLTGYAATFLTKRVIGVTGGRMYFECRMEIKD